MANWLVILTLCLLVPNVTPRQAHLRSFGEMTINELIQKFVQGVKLDKASEKVGEALNTAGQAVNTAAQAVGGQLAKATQVLGSVENVSQNIRQTLSATGQELSKDGVLGGNPHIISDTVKAGFGEAA